PARRQRRRPGAGRGARRLRGAAAAVLSLRPRWRRPAAASLLAAAGYALTRAGQALPAAGSEGPLAAVGGALGAAGDALLLAAAAVAGWPVAVQALRGLAVRVVGIDLLVTVAALGGARRRAR